MYLSILQWYKLRRMRSFANALIFHLQLDVGGSRTYIDPNRTMVRVSSMQMSYVVTAHPDRVRVGISPDDETEQEEVVLKKVAEAIDRAYLKACLLRLPIEVGMNGPR